VANDTTLVLEPFSPKNVKKYGGDLVGGFDPFEKYYSKWESSPTRAENEKSLKPPPSDY